MSPTAEGLQAHRPISIKVREEDRAGVVNHAVTVVCSCSATLHRLSPAPSRDLVMSAMACHQVSDRADFEPVSCLSVSLR